MSSPHPEPPRCARLFALALVACGLQAGCYSRSYPVARVTRDAIFFAEPDEPLTIVGEPQPVQEEECAFQLPFFVVSRADPVRVIQNLFDEHEGDAIIHAELYMFHLPLVLWDDSCVGIRGEMVRTSNPPGVRRVEGEGR